MLASWLCRERAMNLKWLVVESCAGGWEDLFNLPGRESYTYQRWESHYEF